ncbi:hypothetical protein E2C01_078136 [Portunus trituberculatus]|uniref:Uncharacterized protein n=1 Tax=Portunus trituberculatus TaxID=210409 RepID=A0A5B7IPC9_PORTR|nr:hypothetical protein [Portunus trituberculatus]
MEGSPAHLKPRYLEVNQSCSYRTQTQRLSLSCSAVTHALIHQASGKRSSLPSPGPQRHTSFYPNDIFIVL